ncbi:MAG: hypothetical protein JXR41_00410 [Bacteroidales bacterium]|nr:hypothetical protein [Bacteroidales bacterium]MBN2761521.1 hypothetical protein [Bacteroidales bacterium]
MKTLIYKNRNVLFCSYILKRSLICFLLFIPVKEAFTQDMIIKKAGDTLFCKILSVDDYKVIYNIDIDGKLLKNHILKADVIKCIRNYEKKKSMEVYRNAFRTTVGLSADYRVSFGEFSRLFGNGFGVEALLIVPNKKKTVGYSLGVNYNRYNGKTYTYPTSSGTAGEIQYDGGFISFSIGPVFGKMKSAYFIPSISVSYFSDFCAGLDFGGGFLVPLAKSSKLRFGAKLSRYNLIGSGFNDSGSAYSFMLLAGVFI